MTNSKDLISNMTECFSNFRLRKVKRSIFASEFKPISFCMKLYCLKNLQKSVRFREMSSHHPPYGSVRFIVCLLYRDSYDFFPKFKVVFLQQRSLTNLKGLISNMAEVSFCFVSIQWTTFFTFFTFLHCLSVINSKHNYN